MNKDQVKETIICCDCGLEFDLTYGESEWFLSKGLNIPKRCKPCRQSLRRKLNQEIAERREVQHG